MDPSQAHRPLLAPCWVSFGLPKPSFLVSALDVFFVSRILDGFLMDVGAHVGWLWDAKRRRKRKRRTFRTYVGAKIQEKMM